MLFNRDGNLEFTNIQSLSSPHSSFTKVKLGTQMKGLLEEVFGSFQLGKHHGLTIFFFFPMPYTNFPVGTSV